MDLIMRIAKGKKPPGARKPEAEEPDEDGEESDEAGDYDSVKDDAVGAIFTAIKDEDSDGLKAALEDFVSACKG